MYQHKKAKKHHFDKDCCRIIKVRNADKMFERMGLKRQNLSNNRDHENGITTNNLINRDYDKQQQKVTYAPLRTKNNKHYSDNQLNYTPSKDETMMKGFGQSTKVFVMGDSNNKSKSFKIDSDQDKENNNQGSQTKQFSQTQLQQHSDINQALPQIMQMLFEIKNQNLYLIERNLELEQVINAEIKPTINEGFYELRSELRDLKRITKTQDYLIKKQSRVTKTTKRVQKIYAEKRYQQTQALNYVTNEVIKIEATEESKSQQFHQQAATVIVNNLQLASGAESTFMRNLEETVEIPSYELNTPQFTGQNDTMRFSVGANLLELMGMGNQNNNANEQKKIQEKKRGRRVRNFNFRCNLNEIDKIIEEDINETNPTIDCSNYVYSNNASPSNKMEQINNEIRQIEQQEQMEKSMPIDLGKYQSEEKRNNSNNKDEQRPQTANMNKIQRKGWGPANAPINNRPRTGAANAPLRIGKGMISRVGGSGGTGQNDNILALLSQETEEIKQQECKTEDIINTNQLSNGSKDVIQTKQSDNEMKIEDLKASVPPRSQNNQTKIQAQKPIQPRKRGMFKAPPSDLLEQLLLDDSNLTQDNDSANKAQTPVKSIEDSTFDNQNEMLKINNFMIEQQPSKSRSRSRSHRLQNSNSTNIVANSTQNNSGVKKIIFNKPINQNPQKAKFNLQFFDSEDEECKQANNLQNSNKSKTKKNDLEDDNPFQSSTLMNLQNQNERQEQKLPLNSQNTQVRKRQQFAKQNIKSIEELLRGEIQQDQDTVQDNNAGSHSSSNDDDGDSQELTQTEKQGVFFINNGRKINNSNDNTGEFGSQ